MSSDEQSQPLINNKNELNEIEVSILPKTNFDITLEELGMYIINKTRNLSRVESKEAQIKSNCINKNSSNEPSSIDNNSSTKENNINLNVYIIIILFITLHINLIFIFIIFGKYNKRFGIIIEIIINNKKNNFYKNLYLGEIFFGVLLILSFIYIRFLKLKNLFYIKFIYIDNFIFFILLSFSISYFMCRYFHFTYNNLFAIMMLFNICLLYCLFFKIIKIKFLLFSLLAILILLFVIFKIKIITLIIYFFSSILLLLKIIIGTLSYYYDNENNKIIDYIKASIISLYL